MEDLSQGRHLVRVCSVDFFRFQDLFLSTGIRDAFNGRLKRVAFRRKEKKKNGWPEAAYVLQKCFLCRVVYSREPPLNIKAKLERVGE